MSDTFKETIRFSGTHLCHLIQKLCFATRLSSVAVTG